jgi:GTP diphosphokinase / guanosine-3',5'-bis(diphosphate) 3'-diphosphatase
MTVLETAGRHEELLEELVADVAEYIPDADTELVRRAFEFAADRHEGQQRRSGEDFIHHPFGVAKICATELHLEEQVIAAALLHDVVEDTEADIEEVRAAF